MDLNGLRQQHFKAAERYLEAVVELQRMRAAGVSRQDYQVFWRQTVDPAGSAVRAARVALEQGHG